MSDDKLIANIVMGIIIAALLIAFWPVALGLLVAWFTTIKPMLEAYAEWNDKPQEEKTNDITLAWVIFFLLIGGAIYLIY